MPDDLSPATAIRASTRRGVLASAVAGAVAALGHAPFSLPVLSLAAFAAGLLFLSLSPSARIAAWRGWAFGGCHFAVTLHWIVEPFLVDVARHGWMAPFALVFLSGGLGLFWAIGAWVGIRVFPQPGWRRLCGLAATIFLAEIARSFVFTGFPWALPGYIWIDTPIAMLASFAGVHGLSLLTLILAAMAALAVAPSTGATSRFSAGGALALFLVFGWTFGSAMLGGASPNARSDAPIIRLVQPNAAQHLKWRSDWIPVFWERKLALTALPAERAPDLVVWPEVSLPYLLGSRVTADAEVVAAAGGVPVLVGAQRFEGNDLRNAVAVLRPDGRIGPIYDKRHLVPFGEYFPGGQIAALLGLKGLATTMLGGFTPGSESRVLDLTDLGLGRVLALICYEAIFPRHARGDGPRPDWIVQMTNDAWFGNFAGPQQHLDHARMRAIEQGLPLVRVANTGISALIDAQGRIVAELGLNVDGYIDVALPDPEPETGFYKGGNWPAVLAAMLLLFGLRITHRQNAD